MKRSLKSPVLLWTPLLILVIGIGLAIILVNQPSEPRLNGRTILELAENCGHGGMSAHDRQREAGEFIKRIGEPGYRELSRVLLLESPRPEGAVDRWLRKFKSFFVHQRFNYYDALHGAEQIFTMLGTNAAPAIPYLAPAMKTRTHAQSAGCVLAVLGEGATPILAEALTNEDPIIQMAGIGGMGLRGANPKPLMPLIKQAAGSTNEWVSIYALIIVAEHGLLGSNDFLMLEKHSKSPDRWLAAEAFKMMTNRESANAPSR